MPRKPDKSPSLDLVFVVGTKAGSPQELRRTRPGGARMNINGERAASRSANLMARGRSQETWSARSGRDYGWTPSDGR
jgi:hypothetical protein